MQRSGRQGEVRVTAGLGEDLHLRIHAASMSARRIRQRKISMHKAVARLAGTGLQRQTAMTKREVVPKLGQHAARVFGCVGLVPSMMEMNLHLAPSSMAIIRQ